jgi:predicted nucleic acid-binding protein
MVPAIAYYEVLRELEQLQATAQIARLKTYALEPMRFVPLTTEHLEHAAGLWGRSRRAGRPTADRHALDCDVILVAQALSLGIPTTDLIVATTNTSHITQYLPADLWTNIAP